MHTSSGNQDFPPTASVGTDFTMSDVSHITGFGDSLRGSYQQQSAGVSQEMAEAGKLVEATLGQGVHKQTGDAELGQGVHKQSSNSKESSGKSHESLQVSDLMGSQTSFGFGFGLTRTHSFPDHMLSTGDLLPPMNRNDSEKEDSNNEYVINDTNETLKDEGHQRQSSTGSILRHSSSESSNHSMTGGFHPVRSRNNTAISGLNDAMSLMSMDSRKSAKSESSSWMENFRSMQSIHSDVMNPSQLMNDDAGSVRSFLSDVSNELNALDLAEPLLPPMIHTDSGLNDSGDFAMAASGNRPDP